MNLLKKVQSLLKQKGFKYKRTTASANADWKWTKEETGQKVELGGWYANPKWGPLAVIMDLNFGDNYRGEGVFKMPTTKDSGLPENAHYLTPPELKAYKQNINTAWEKIQSYVD